MLIPHSNRQLFLYFSIKPLERKPARVESMLTCNRKLHIEATTIPIVMDLKQCVSVGFSCCQVT